MICQSLLPQFNALVILEAMVGLCIIPFSRLIYIGTLFLDVVYVYIYIYIYIYLG